MKPVDFRYARPHDLDEAVRLLRGNEFGSKILAGGQSLGPMLNLRLVQPELLIDVTTIPALTAVREEKDAVLFGACVTHSAIEDGRVPDPTRGFLQSVAGGIAYRAVRNRGTLGGSVAHADPSADWLTALTVLDAEALVFGPAGDRTVRISELVSGPFTVELGPAEIVAGIRIRRLSRRARYGYFKFCRKRGEFAEAMAAVLVDPELGISRAVIGATESRPAVVDGIAELVPEGGRDGTAARAKVLGLSLSEDPIKSDMLATALVRALGQLVQ